jgi:hypothetical protein
MKTKKSTQRLIDAAILWAEVELLYKHKGSREKMSMDGYREILGILHCARREVFRQGLLMRNSNGEAK